MVGTEGLPRSYPSRMEASPRSRQVTLKFGGALPLKLACSSTSSGRTVVETNFRSRASYDTNGIIPFQTAEDIATRVEAVATSSDSASAACFFYLFLG